MNFSFNIQLIIKIITPILIIGTSFVLGFIFEKRILKNLKKIARKNNWKYDDIIVDSFQGIGLVWLILGGVFLSLPTLSLPPAAITFVEKFLLATFLASATLFTSRLFVELLKVFTTKEDGISPLTSLFEFLTKIVIYSLGTLIILQSIGIKITPLLTALGVGGVSVGLALQTTLSNLMSGVNIIMSGKVKPGDYITLSSGEKGYVIDVELKYTVLQEITENLLVIPNSKIISGSFKNFSLPEKQIVIPINIGVSYDSDLEEVEKITLEVAREMIKIINNQETNFQPFIRYQNFDYFSINFTVYIQIFETEFFEHLKVKHIFLKKLHKKYQEVGIKIPFPLTSGYVSSSFPQPLNYN